MKNRTFNILDVLKGLDLTSLHGAAQAAGEFMAALRGAGRFLGGMGGQKSFFAGALVGMGTAIAGAVAGTLMMNDSESFSGENLSGASYTRNGGAKRRKTISGKAGESDARRNKASPGGPGDKAGGGDARGLKRLATAAGGVAVAFAALDASAGSAVAAADAFSRSAGGSLGGLAGGLDIANGDRARAMRGRFIAWLDEAMPDQAGDPPGLDGGVDMSATLKREEEHGVRGAAVSLRRVDAAVRQAGADAALFGGLPATPPAGAALGPAFASTGMAGSGTATLNGDIIINAPAREAGRIAGAVRSALDLQSLAAQGNKGRYS